MDKNKNKKKSAKAKKQTGKKACINKLIIIVAAVNVVLIAAVLLGCYFNYFDFKDVKDFIVPEKFIEDVHPEDGDDFQVNPIEELRQDSSLSAVLKDWATVGYDESKLMKSKDVIVFLLVGLDESGANSDVMMLMSCNKKEGKIHLNSLMRDSYTYMKTPFGEKYSKLNAAYANGGINCLVDTVQRNYKIQIDNYFIVNFQTFADVVNTVGGIEVNVKQYEAKAAGISRWGENTLLNGKEALAFCRIRHCDFDGDVSRTRRQRDVITALVKKAKDVKLNQIDDILSSLTRHVQTDCPNSKLVSLGTQALMGKWYSFSIESKEMPLPDNRKDYNGAAWVWIVDFPGDAVALQTEIFGKTNIALNKERVTAIDVFKRVGM